MKTRPSPVALQRTGRRPAAVKGVAVAYAVSGGLAALREALSTGLLPKGIRTLVIPTTEKAEGALKASQAFRRTNLYAEAAAGGRQAASDVAVQAHGSARTHEIDAGAYEPDARARAILRGKAYAGEDLRMAGGAYNVDEVRELLDVSRQALDKRVKEGSLLAVPGPSGGRRFPTLQFDDHGGLVRGLKQVQAALNVSSPWAVLNFLINENDRLDGLKPIDVLRRGDIGMAVDAARCIGMQGA